MDFQMVRRQGQKAEPHLFVVRRELLSVDQFVSGGLGALPMVLDHDTCWGQVDLCAVLVEQFDLGQPAHVRITQSAYDSQN